MYYYNFNLHVMTFLHKSKYFEIMFLNVIHISGTMFCLCSLPFLFLLLSRSAQTIQGKIYINSAPPFPYPPHPSSTPIPGVSGGQSFLKRALRFDLILF